MFSELNSKPEKWDCICSLWPSKVCFFRVFRHVIVSHEVAAGTIIAVGGEHRSCRRNDYPQNSNLKRGRKLIMGITVVESNGRTIYPNTDSHYFRKISSKMQAIISFAKQLSIISSSSLCSESQAGGVYSTVCAPTLYDYKPNRSAIDD